MSFVYTLVVEDRSGLQVGSHSSAESDPVVTTYVSTASAPGLFPSSSRKEARTWLRGSLDQQVLMRFLLAPRNHFNSSVARFLLLRIFPASDCSDAMLRPL